MKAANGRANHLFPDDQKNRPHDSILLNKETTEKVHNRVGSAVLSICDDIKNETTQEISSIRFYGTWCFDVVECTS